MEKAARGCDGAPRGPVLHIVVVGFHHKKGCQVEFSYPPLIPGDGHDSPTIPEEWKYLPFLALPDGAHNYQEGFESPACRCHQRDRAEKRLCSKQAGTLRTHEQFLGRSATGGVPSVSRSVASGSCASFSTQGMIEHGLRDCSQYKPRKSMSEDAGLQENNPPADDFVSVSAPNITCTNSETAKKTLTGNHDGDAAIATEEPLFPAENSSKGLGPSETSPYLKPPSRPSPESSESDWETLDPSILEERDQVGSEQTNSFPRESVPSDSAPITVQPQANMGQVVLLPGLISGLEEDQYGMPLAIFTKGYLCLPYMALQQHHLLSDVTVRGFVAGATNILFRQQKHLSDAIVEVEEALIQVQDPELRKLLSPTTADLRFADYLVKHVTENRDDIFLDGTGWEGGDEWIRAQFAVYIHALLAATLQPDNEKVLADYGTAFVMAWKNTHNYRVWNSNRHPALAEINPNHPFQGQYSVSDMRLRFSHSVQNSERGKKIGNVMVSTSRNVVQTGKAVGQSVGGALSSAKTAMSSWLSTFTGSTPQSLPEPPGKP
ncbi:late secretory pathway protein AVL9 homolog isoform X5 [Pipistrellus kuhlii]|uniref:late secretory pathway protein AVL9 homolog isoform X5 n=1 Tax=Pipistrellus kuhlii TaxID=59472 RepID=UPI00174F7251|nr:late secretory pathway protein AVL9 homolog isoform X5 [Pipistrellus kuhlii]